MLHVINISTTGFMVKGEVALQRGERLTIRLKRIGRDRGIPRLERQHPAGLSSSSASCAVTIS
jgi:hypothetical protein